MLPAGNASPWTGPTGNNTYLLTGAVMALVDAGVGNAGHLDAVEGALQGRALDLVLPTHGHPDHVAGIPATGRRIAKSQGTPISEPKTMASVATDLLINRVLAMYPTRKV